MSMEKKSDLIGKIIVITLIAVFVAVGITSMTKGKPAAATGMTEKPAAAAVTVSVKTVAPETIQKTVLLNGEVSSRVETNIYPDTSGKISQVLKDIGDDVKRGDIIAYVDPSKPGSAYAASPVRATVAGTITYLPFHAGDTISSSTALATIGSLQDLEITLNVSEKYSSYIKNGLVAYVSLLSAPDTTFEAEITSISPVVNPASRTQQVTLKFNKNDPRIKPGMFAQVRLVIQEEENVFVLPQTALKTYNDDTTVFIVTPDDKAKRVVVTTGISNDADTQITSGLVSGDKVITAGSVTEGSKIRIAPSSRVLD